MTQFMNVEVQIDPAPAADRVEAIEQQLLAALGQSAPASGYGTLGIFARAADGEIVAGLIGSTSHGWLLVKILWVMEQFRGRGFGSHLMQVAEEEGRRRGCHAAWLDTSSVRARDFYERLGYEVFATLENSRGEQPEGHCRWLMRKRLRESDRGAGTHSSAAQ